MSADLRIDEELAICEAATQWGVLRMHTYEDGTSSNRIFEHLTGRLIADNVDGPDATFIAHARTGYPIALRRIQELEQQLAAAMAERDAAIAELAEVDKPCAICNRRVRDAIGVDWCAACDADERYRDAKEANDVLALQVARLTEDVAYLKNRADRMHDERTKRIVKLSDEVKELKRALTPDTEATDAMRPM